MDWLIDRKLNKWISKKNQVNSQPILFYFVVNEKYTYSKAVPSKESLSVKDGIFKLSQSTKLVNKIYINVYMYIDV